MSFRFMQPSKISKCLHCPICINVFDRPKRTNCGHTFCENCVKSYIKSQRSKAQCPICRKGITCKSLGIDRIAELAINDILVVCLHKGCCWTGKLKDFRDHKENCVFCPEKIEPYISRILPEHGFKEDEDLMESPEMSLAGSIYLNFPEVAKGVFGCKEEKQLDLDLFTLPSLDN